MRRRRIALCWLPVLIVILVAVTVRCFCFCLSIFLAARCDIVDWKRGKSYNMKLEWSKRLAHQFVCILHEHMRQQVQKNRWVVCSNTFRSTRVAKGPMLPRHPMFPLRKWYQKPATTWGVLVFFLNLTKVSNLQSGNPLSLGLSKKDSESGSLGPSIVATSGNCFAAARASWVSAMAKKWKNQKWSELHYPLVMSK